MTRGAGGCHHAYWRRKLLTIETHESLKADLEEIAKMLSGLINGLDKREV